MSTSAIKQLQRQLRVCVVTPLPPPYGGMAIQGEKLIQGLRSQGVSVTVVPTNPALPQRLSALARIPVLRTLIRTLVFVRHMVMAAKKTGVIYFLSGFPNFFFWVTLPAIGIAKWFRVPFILNARGGEAPRFFKQWAWLLAPVIRNLALVTVPSPYLATAFVQNCRVVPVLVPNLADLAQFSWQARERFRPRFIVARNLEPYYNVACAIRGFDRIRRTVSGAVMGIAGQGSLEGELKALVHSLGLERAVTFHGAVPHEQMPALYQAYDIMINTSLVDNFPGAILEAFASGLVVVTSGAGGIPFLVKDRVSGLILGANHETEVCRCCLEILENQDLGQDLVRNGYDVCRTFGWDGVWASLGPLLETHHG